MFLKESPVHGELEENAAFQNSVCETDVKYNLWGKMVTHIFEGQGLTWNE